jgi:hypothetical protein
MQLPIKIDDQSVQDAFVLLAIRAEARDDAEAKEAIARYLVQRSGEDGDDALTAGRNKARARP